MATKANIIHRYRTRCQNILRLSILTKFSCASTLLTIRYGLCWKFVGGHLLCRSVDAAAVHKSVLQYAACRQAIVAGQRKMNSTGMVCIATLNKIYVLPSPQCYWYVQNLRCYASVAGQTGLLPVRILC